MSSFVPVRWLRALRGSAPTVFFPSTPTYLWFSTITTWNSLPLSFPFCKVSDSRKSPSSDRSSRIQLLRFLDVWLLEGGTLPNCQHSALPKNTRNFLLNSLKIPPQASPLVSPPLRFFEKSSRGKAAKTRLFFHFSS